MNKRLYAECINQLLKLVLRIKNEMSYLKNNHIFKKIGRQKLILVKY